jgi:hypothetical protein
MPPRNLVSEGDTNPRTQSRVFCTSVDVAHILRCFVSQCSECSRNNPPSPVRLPEAQASQEDCLRLSRTPLVVPLISPPPKIPPPIARMERPSPKHETKRRHVTTACVACRESKVKVYSNPILLAQAKHVLRTDAGISVMAQRRLARIAWPKARNVGTRPEKTSASQYCLSYNIPSQMR